MTVYKFNVFFEFGGEANERYVVAKNEDEATHKIAEHFVKQHKLGFAYPVYVAEPTVEYEGVIV